MVATIFVLRSTPGKLRHGRRGADARGRGSTAGSSAVEPRVVRCGSRRARRGRRRRRCRCRCRQAAGVAAAMSAKRGVTPRELPVSDLQAALVEQKLKLAFYWDVEASNPAFAAIQLLSVRGFASGDAGRCFRPSEPLTRADAAQLVYRAFELWPSVSNVHFTDVPHTPDVPRNRDLVRSRCADHLRDRAAVAQGGWIRCQQALRFPTEEQHRHAVSQPARDHWFNRLMQYIQAGEGPLNPKGRRFVPAAIAASAGSSEPLTRGQACVLLWQAMGTR